MKRHELHDKVERLNKLFLEVRAAKIGHPEHLTGYQPQSYASLLNAYREGDIGFDDCVTSLRQVKPLTCLHEDPVHCADNGSRSSGCIYWCWQCGAISITMMRPGNPSEFEWQLPGERNPNEE